MRRWVVLRETAWDLVLERPEERVCGRCGQVFRARYRPQRLCATCVEEGNRLSADGLRERRAVRLVGLREECGEAWRGPAGRLETLRPVWPPEVWAAVQEWLTAWPHGPGLVLWGPERTGKTALAVGLLRWACERHGVVGRFVSAPRLLDVLRRFPSVEAAERTVLAGLLEEPLVVVDALGEGEEGVERAWVAALGCWLADRVMWKQRLVVTTRRSPAALSAWFGAAAWEVFGGMVRLVDLSARAPGGVGAAAVAPGERSELQPCPGCLGAGWVRDPRGAIGSAQRVRRCPVCGGRGF